MRAETLGDLGVPTLAEVLLAVGRRPFLDVELKGDPGPGVVAALAAGRGPELHNAVISSFDRAALEAIGRRAPTWPRWLNARTLDDSVVSAAQDLGCRGVSRVAACEWPGALEIPDRDVATSRRRRLADSALTLGRRRAGRRSPPERARPRSTIARHISRGLARRRGDLRGGRRTGWSPAVSAGRWARAPRSQSTGQQQPVPPQQDEPATTGRPGRGAGRLTGRIEAALQQRAWSPR